MDTLRKQLMAMPPEADARDAKCGEAIEGLNDLRKMFDELAAKADRPTIEDIRQQPPADYVATMKPLVRNYHQQLMSIDKLAPCLCEDLQASGVVLMLVGDGKTVIRTAVDPNREEVQLAIEIILQSLDEGMKKVAEEGVEAAEQQLGITAPEQGDCKVALGLMEPDPRSGGCDQPTCMRCYPEPGDPPLENS
jgi:hypothetical protein